MKGTYGLVPDTGREADRAYIVKHRPDDHPNVRDNRPGFAAWFARIFLLPTLSVLLAPYRIPDKGPFRGCKYTKRSNRPRACFRRFLLYFDASGHVVKV